jgi:hypothetical protein
LKFEFARLCWKLRRQSRGGLGGLGGFQAPPRQSRQAVWHHAIANQEGGEERVAQARAARTEPQGEQDL